MTDAAVARALRQGHGFLGHFLAPRSPSEVAPALGMAPNLVHHHARKLADLGLLFEARREGGKVYYQLAAREFRVPWEVVNPLDGEGGEAVELHRLMVAFGRAYERSFRRVGQGEEAVFGFGDGNRAARPLPVPDAPPAEPCPTHLDALTLRLSPERYARLVRAVTALLDEAAAEGVREGGYPCTVALLAFQGVPGEGEAGAFNGIARRTSSFLGALTD